MSRPVYRFGPYRLHPAARELRCDGERVAATQKVIDSLVWLIEHRDRAVGRDELIAAVWGRVDVSDTHLGKTMFQVRRAIGDSGDDQGMILTVPRFGYRWIAPLVVEGESDAATVAATGAAPGPTPPPAAIAAPAPARPEPAPDPTGAAAGNQPRGRHGPIAAAVALLAVLALLAWAVMRHRQAPVPPDAIAAQPSGAVAVLPVDVHAEGEWTWLRLGLMDLIAQRLRGAGLIVVPSESIVALTRDAPIGVRSDAAAEIVGRATGADRLLRASAVLAGTQWTVRLSVDGRDGPAQSAEADGEDVIAAARLASDRLLAAFGRVAAAEPGAVPSLETLRHQVQAALLAGTPAAAREAWERLPPALRDAPEARLQHARIDIAEGRLDAARMALADLLAQVSAEDDPLLRVRVLFEAGHAEFFRAGAPAPVAFYDEALTLLGDRPLPVLRAAAHAWRGIAYAKAGAAGAARGDFALARVVLQQAGDALGLARIDVNEGLLDLADGRPADALPLLRRAAATFERFGQSDNLARAWVAEAGAELAQARPDRALAVATRAAALAERIDTPLARSQLLGTQAAVLAANGRIAEARRSLAAARAAAVEAGERSLERVLGAAAAELDLDAGANEAAQAAAAAAVTELQSPDQAAERARAWLTLTRALRRLGRADEAAAASRALAAWAAASDRPPVQVSAALAEAEQADADGDSARARDRYETALEAARRSGPPARIIEVADAYGGRLLAEGDPARAAAVIAQVERWAAWDFTAAVLQARLQQTLGQDAAARRAWTHARALAGERPLERLAATPDRAR
ncbi:MAG TPA: winged helix-turn-helix domain-containing protein [Dokdonella sp.]|uniref:winged helix-turn-helix domain-containing protein n=1 Tax=Dokdonella sp. TaxID=2291710 RepID=UPI002C3E4387|nr:winged helix-turn-helix domain-containing protein [Dokdonella sp.]HUD42531.1 winged helix-turn-helix domain-containing protein [Dokdonella sp.]